MFSFMFITWHYLAFYHQVFSWLCLLQALLRVICFYFHSESVGTRSKRITLKKGAKIGWFWRCSAFFLGYYILQLCTPKMSSGKTMTRFCTFQLYAESHRRPASHCFFFLVYTFKSIVFFQALISPVVLQLIIPELATGAG